MYVTCSTTEVQPHISNNESTVNVMYGHEIGISRYIDTITDIEQIERQSIFLQPLDTIEVSNTFVFIDIHCIRELQKRIFSV